MQCGYLGVHGGGKSLRSFFCCFVAVEESHCLFSWSWDWAWDGGWKPLPEGKLELCIDLVSCNDRMRIWHLECWGELLILGKAGASGWCLVSSKESKEALPTCEMCSSAFAYVMVRVSRGGWSPNCENWALVELPNPPLPLPKSTFFFFLFPSLFLISYFQSWSMLECLNFGNIPCSIQCGTSQ